MAPLLDPHRPKDFFRPKPHQMRGRLAAKASKGVGRTAGRIQKKSPASAWKTGDLPACTLHSLFLEDLSVKNIQAGFLTLGSFYYLRLPALP
jgi:hypothetical protein